MLPMRKKLLQIENYWEKWEGQEGYELCLQNYGSAEDIFLHTPEWLDWVFVVLAVWLSPSNDDKYMNDDNQQARET